ncbi:general stress protein 13 [Pullulanibacillus pueri]|uniref:General stress protein 13 n=1 Tax=Pullulanibacillus pueri TaxID=1437324 RepID=A0A8J3EK63_9BACL|nr:S1 domain-containing post-transcriptional regulator GSP13 [Pullulanibacillus pueri]MBM7680444.1 general stress protein 13 [Pullulanibacillus pueri]GGH75060.1 general stress protein 13 [Pullulanibacillus pueri]
MLDQYNVGDIVEGKVTGIKSFGAFVALDDKHQGLVHISEISHDFVKDINEKLSVGDTVKVKILKIDQDAGKVSLSIRQTQPKPERPAATKRTTQASGSSNNNRRGSNDNTGGFNTLEQKLKNWIKESNEKQAQLNKRLKK